MPTTQHLDADQIAAFAEDALSAQERALCLTHLAECARCREIAFLAGAALPAKEVEPKRSFAWWPMLPLAGAVFAAIAVAFVMLHRPQPQPPVQVATVQPQPPVVIAQPALPRVAHEAKKLPSMKRAEPQVLDERQVESLPLQGRAVAQPPAARVMGGMAGGVGMGVAAAPAAAAPQPYTLRSEALDSMSSNAASGMVVRSRAVGGKVVGVVTDQAGAVIPGATVLLSQNAARREVKTGPNGAFAVSGLTPGTYDVQISAPGFVPSTRSVEVTGNEVAQLDSKLMVGAESATLEVSAAAADVATADAVSLAALTPVLQSSVSRGELTLALNDKGEVLLRKSAAGAWKKVHGPWKKARVSEVSLTAAQAFEVHADGGVWSSADGKHWVSVAQP